jgi:hypothetical protein
MITRIFLEKKKVTRVVRRVSNKQDSRCNQGVQITILV